MNDNIEVQLLEVGDQPIVRLQRCIIQIMLKDKDSKQSIQVTIRVRPLSQKQKFEDPRVCVFMQQSHSLSLVNGGDPKKFTFDSISYQQSQQQIFERVGRRCTKDCLQGYNCTIFAYGQTGAGKTYTMMGVTSDHEQYEYHRGLIPRTINYLFECIDLERAEGVNFIIRCSFLEIYNEQIIDLLNKNNTNLQLREDTRKGVYVEGITQEVVGKSEQIMELLHKGSKSRHVGSTFYNQTSSRSHSVFTMSIESKYTKNGVVNTKSRSFNFIDLAGSERTKMSTGDRLKQGCNINKSLMNLASVINSLSQVSEGKMQHVNYRNSKLTFLLKDSLGGNSKTNLIANISPSTMFYQETLSTLSFARRAKLIKRSKASINEDSSGNLDSMKNQIKRLKQEVITLMGRLQSQKGVQGNSSTDSTPQMTSIMHQYVSEQIDKQTRLEMEILKLRERISHLQDGIKHYASSQTHLRLIIAVLEDKITRLKSIQNRLSFNMEEIDNDEERVKVVKEYFEKQREDLIKQVDAFRGQSQGTRIIKELLKQAKVMRQDGQEDESLKQLLTKNTNFLNMIHAKLEQIAPEKQQIEFNADFEKKVSEIQIEYHKKEQQYVERLQQINLQLNEAQSRNQQNQKLLEDAINIQISLEQKVKLTSTEKQQLEEYLRSEETRRKALQQQMRQIVTKNEQIVTQLKNDINNSQMEQSLMKNEIDTLKGKLEKMTVNEKYLKEEFDCLEEEKCKLDKTLMQNIEEMKDKKNELMKKDSEISILKQQIQAISKEKQEINQTNNLLSNELAEEKKSNKIKLEQIQSQNYKQLQIHVEKEEQLSKQIEQLESKLKQTEKRFSEESQELQILAKQFGQMENTMKKKLQSKQAQLKETIALINQKQQNGNQIEYNLNQLKAELINLRAEKENNQTKLNKIIDDLRQKLEKEHQNFGQLQLQANERAKMYDQLFKEHGQKKKQLNQIKQNSSKLQLENSSLEKDMKSLETKLENIHKDLDSHKQKEKEQRFLAMEMKNELFVAQKNAEIEIDALRSQLSLKEQNLQQIEKENSKNKMKYEKQIEQLHQQIQKSKEIFDEHEKSMKKSMESHLLSKEKKVTQLRTTLTEKQNIVRQQQITIFEQSQKIKHLQTQKVDHDKMISELNSIKEQMRNQIQQLKQDQEQLFVKHEKQIEESEITHNEQLDQKTQMIENYLNQIEILTQQNQTLKSRIQKEQEKVLKQMTDKGHMEVEINTLNSTISDLHQKIEDLNNKRKQDETKINSSSQKIEVLEDQKEEIQQNLQVRINQIQTSNKEIQQLGEQISELQQQNKQLKDSLQETKKKIIIKTKQLAEKIQQMQHEMNSFDDQKTKKIGQLQIELETIKASLQESEKANKDARTKLNEANNFARDLSIALQHDKSEISNFQASIRRLEDEKVTLEEDKKKHQQTIKVLKQELKQFQDLNDSLNKDLQLQIEQLQVQIVNKNELVQNMKKQLKEFKEDNVQKQQKSEIIIAQLNTLKGANQQLSQQVIQLDKNIKENDDERKLLKEKISNYEAVHTKMSAQFEENSQYKQKWELQTDEIQTLRQKIQNEEQSKQRIYSQVCKQRQNNSNLKLIIDNSEAQVRQLTLQLQEKDSIYKKLLEKIAKNQNQNRKSTNSSEHYLKTIELLQKSRSQQLEMRRQNQQLRKKNEEQALYVKQIEKKSEGYCVSMHKRLEEIQKDYFDLERRQQSLIKEKKALEKCSSQNDILKEEIRNMKISANKMVQRQQQLENRFKKCNIDYIELQKQFEQLKKGQTMINNHDDKTNYINRLKAQVAALKTEKVLLTDSLNKEREEKTKLKAEMRYGKDGAGDLGAKIDLEKKINQNKNLQQLIFEIVSHLKICVNQPRTKLQTIRSVILNTIKDKNSEVKSLRDRVRELQEMQEAKHMMIREPALKDYKGFNHSLSKNPGRSEELKFEKEKDPSYLNNSTRQKVKDFENYYGKYKQSGRTDKY